jgi:ABC-type glycerol-3-phosphate transport system substrate-binding protein
VILWDASDSPEATSAAYAPIIESFRAEYPGIEVQVVEIAEAEARERFTQASLDRSAPTLLVAPSEWSIELAGGGFLEPLTGTPLEATLADYVRASRPSVEFDNTLWALPQTATSDALVCNERLLSTAGATVPVSWEQVAEAAVVVAESGVTLMLAPATGADALPYLYSQGGGMLDVAESEILVNNPASVTGWDTAVALIAAGATPRALPGALGSPSSQPPSANPGATPANNPTTASEASEAFFAGQLACIVINPIETVALYAGAQAATDVSISINPMPGGASEGATTAQGTTVSVAAAASQAEKDLGYLFAAHLNSTEAQLELARQSAWSPARGDAYRLLSDDTSSTAKVLNAFAPLLETARPWPATPELAQLMPSLDSGWAAMAAGQEPPAQAADAIATQWRTVLPATYRED